MLSRISWKMVNMALTETDACISEWSRYADLWVPSIPATIGCGVFNRCSVSSTLGAVNRQGCGGGVQGGWSEVEEEQRWRGRYFEAGIRRRAKRGVGARSNGGAGAVGTRVVLRRKHRSRRESQSCKAIVKAACKTDQTRAGGGTELEQRRRRQRRPFSRREDAREYQGVRYWCVESKA
ncbi:hypothetical protein FB45DRAFT_1002404 [Roridomyces roridus]|uniref:Uncharacterized protein n=1 Tax=Roridomyces roridus TaxID=1738132 RepID=A0AAD7BZL8_9AGAR|nr:hypothetical protein FB45DRAFT_1002404 [Roridomyces roridus]